MGQRERGVDEVSEASGGECIADGDGSAQFAAEIAYSGVALGRRRDVGKIDDRKGQVGRQR